MLISNIRENGETIGALPDGEMMFHHDTIHRDDPHKATLLYSVEIPTHGGDTLFASGTAAYDTLDPAMKKKLEGLRAVNYYVYNSVKRNDKQGVDATSQAVHPVVRTHDETKRKALYVNRLMSVRIEGMPEADSDKTLNFLFDHAEKPEFVYTHVWRKGDLIVWDNRNAPATRAPTSRRISDGSCCAPPSRATVGRIDSGFRHLAKKEFLDENTGRGAYRPIPGAARIGRRRRGFVREGGPKNSMGRHGRRR
jgi:taurine dioxygenase